mgnify:FL=1
MEPPPSGDNGYRRRRATIRLIVAARAVEFASVVIMSEDDTDPAPTAVEDHGGRPPWLGPALIAIAALLIGLGGGLAIGSAKSGSDGEHPHGNATAIGFSQDMIVHHGQAVEMTQIVIKRGSDPAVRDLAVTMLTDQNREIGQMTGWLQAWGAPLTNPGAPMSWMGQMGHGSGDHCADGHVDEHCPAAKADGHGGHDGTGGHAGHGAPTAASPAADDGATMEGMATKAEMARLSSLNGPDADTYFLQLMLRHHQGGHHMMSMVIDPANGAPEYVRALAEQMDKAQTAEESTMKQMLAQRHAQPLG